jgi:hypothetical protein
MVLKEASTQIDMIMRDQLNDMQRLVEQEMKTIGRVLIFASCNCTSSAFVTSCIFLTCIDHCLLLFF